MAESTDLRGWLEAGAKAVKHARGRLDAINVFPVADADTGTNMFLTLKEGNRAVSKLGDDASHTDVVAAFVRGTLTGARGNSGIIISQYFQGLLTSIDEHGGLGQIRADGLAQSLAAAAESAYRAVGTPVEGTMLTVARAAASGAADAVVSGAERGDMMVAAVKAARDALALTHEQLPSAHEAGVVDAGAAGLVLQLEELANALGGAAVIADLDQVPWEIDSHAGGSGQPAFALHDSGAYEVMFVTASDDDIRDDLTAKLEAIGDSVAVTGADRLWQAHVHTDAPHQAVEHGMRTRARQIVVRNLTVGHDGDRASTGVVALTTCPGLAAPLADAGAVVLVVPEPERLKRRALRRAVKDASGTAAVVVAGHPSLRAAALALAERKRRPALTVLPAEHEAQVIAAVAAAALMGPGGDVVVAMREAVASTQGGASSKDALDHDVDAMVTRDTEVVTLIVAAGVPEAVTDAVRLSVPGIAPHADVNVYRGGHTAPAVLIGVETPR